MVQNLVCECGWSTTEGVAYCEICGLKLNDSERPYYMVIIDNIIVKVEIVEQERPFIANDINSYIANGL